MEFIDKNLLAYAEQHSSPEPELLKKINRETHLNVLKPRMLSGHLQGRLLAMISRMISPDKILEIGTFTGYSALCLAEGLRPDGTLVTIDRNDELEDRVRQYFEASAFSNQIDYRIGNAIDIIPQIEGPFGLVFIDADKDSNQKYYDLVIGKVKVGGYIIADNVLWSGKVLDQNPDKKTGPIQEFNDSVQNDHRVENILLPLRDGMMLMRKVGT